MDCPGQSFRLAPSRRLLLALGALHLAALAGLAAYTTTPTGPASIWHGIPARRNIASSFLVALKFMAPSLPHTSDRPRIAPR